MVADPQLATGLDAGEQPIKIEPHKARREADSVN